ncbi:MAG: c-type cytochrome [Nitrospirae bacterium]|nr:MAG: c-type cytochrome [Nitrospirota bacterium]
MANSALYKNPILFAVVTTVVVLIGTVVTMFYPMMTPEMHPKLEGLKQYTPLQLAGKDVYQQEGCVGCHTQTVRPLKTEVLRYGEYSKAGEFFYDHPFLWGSKRTGPDLARIGGKYPDAWQYKHFEDPQSFFAESNMPKYGWLKNNKLDPADVEAHMKALGFTYQPEDIALLNGKSELDALVAYMQVIGTSVKKADAGDKKKDLSVEPVNPFKGDPKAIASGKELYSQNCSACHGVKGEGGIGPSLIDDEFLYVKGDLKDDDYFELINNGTQAGNVEEGRTMKGGMPPYASLGRDKIWHLVSYIRSLQGK